MSQIQCCLGGDIVRREFLKKAGGPPKNQGQRRKSEPSGENYGRNCDHFVSFSPTDRPAATGNPSLSGEAGLSLMKLQNPVCFRRVQIRL